MGKKDFSIAQAAAYIEQNKHLVNQMYKPTHHFSAEIGWINDPNGFVYYKGEYHLFYQFHPYGTTWGPMHWGHAKSKDLIHWEHLPVALAPDQPYDQDGCFSGSAIVRGDELWLMYTGVTEQGGEVKQVQNMAVSTDGIHFTKISQNPVATGELLPPTLSRKDFRDPKIFFKENRYYAVVASQHRSQVGCIVLLGSDNLVDWKFESVFLKGEPHQGIVFECPDYFEVDGVECLIFSPIHYKKHGDSFFNINSSVLMTGHVDWQKKEFIPESVKEIDHGQDFYAPQTLLDSDNRRIMIAWMQMWGRTIHTDRLGHGWAGAMTLPREITIVNGRFMQQVPAMIQDEFLQGTLPMEVTSATHFCLPIETTCAYQLGDTEDYLEFGYDATHHTVYIDRSQVHLVIEGEESWQTSRRFVTIPAKKIDVYLDRHSIELFINEGEESLSATYYLQGKHYLRQVNVER